VQLPVGRSVVVVCEVYYILKYVAEDGVKASRAKFWVC
jgi:hypothetical protein